MKWIRLALIGIGSLALLYAVSGALSSRDMRFAYVRFLSLVPVGHELILVPLAIGVGILVARLVPATIRAVRVRAVIQAAMFLSATIVAVALPGVLGYGRTPDLPSALTRDYTRGLLILLAAVWIGAAATLTLNAFHRSFRKRRSLPPRPRDPST
jgi:hypothetical protein